MLNRDFFSERFKLLRLSHYLSIPMVANLLALKSTGSISPFESGKGIPSSDILVDITNLFGVSLDWLAGRSDSPYNSEVLLRLEEFHIKRLLSIDYSHDEDCKDFALFFLTDDYYDTDKRISTFSLPVRANIIFLINWCQRETEYFIDLKHPFSSRTFSDFKQRITEIWNMNETRASRRKIAMRYMDLLGGLLDGNGVKEPVFDITKPPEIGK